MTSVIAHNRWDLLEVPDVGAWTPKHTVSVVIPYYQAHDALELTLAALAAQTYPSSLLQVVVADDGSEEPLELPERHLGLDVTVVRQQRRGFGAPRARNLGARRARGQILLFLDADMLAEPTAVEAHARWHHACGYAVTLGPRTHVDTGGLAADDVVTAGRDGALTELFAGREQTEPEWISDHLRRTGGLTSADHDLFRVVASGNLGVSRALFDQVGGFDESFDQWGGEDTELGYRLFVGGGLLIHDGQARCWHQGEGHEPDAGERVSLVEQRPKLAQLIAHHGFRRVRRGRTYLVPRVAATVRAGDVDAGAALGAIESLLASSVSDLVVHVEAPEDLQHRRWIERQFEHDARVVFDLDALHPATPFRMLLDAPMVVGMETVEQLLERLMAPDEPVGVVYATVPPARPEDRRLVAWSTRAVCRILQADAAAASAAGSRAVPDATDAAATGDAANARSWLAPGDDLLDRVAQVHGRVWLSGTQLSVGEAATVDPLSDLDSPGTAVAIRGELQSLGEVLGRLDPQQQQRVVEVARTGLTQLSARQLRVLLAVGQRTMRLLGRLSRRRR